MIYVLFINKLLFKHYGNVSPKDNNFEEHSLIMILVNKNWIKISDIIRYKHVCVYVMHP